MSESVSVGVTSKVLEIVTREVWGAEDVSPNLLVSTAGWAVNVILQNTHIRPCKNLVECSKGIRKLQRLHIYHAEKADIKYNFVVCGDGRVYEGRGWEIEPTAPFKFKRIRNNLVIGFDGQYNSNDLPRVMFEAGSQLLWYGLHEGYISPKFQLHVLQRQLEEATF